MRTTDNNQYEMMTTQPVSGLIIRFSIPTIISVLVMNIYSIVDEKFVGKLGTSQSGSVGVAYSVISVLFAFGFLFGQGTGSIISRILGNKDSEDADVVASTGFIMSIVTGLIFGIVGLIFAEPLLYMMGSTSTILPYAKAYIIPNLIAAPFTTGSYTLISILRYEGKVKPAMVGSLLGTIINTILDPLFIFTFNMGLAGAGLATAVTHVITFLVYFYLFVSGRTQCKLSIKHFAKNVKIPIDICTTGFPSLVEHALGIMSSTVMSRNVRTYGDAAVAAMSIVKRASMLMSSVVIGIGQGFQPVSGYNYGAKLYKRWKEAFRFTYILSEITACVPAIVGFCLSSKIIGFFRNDANVIAFGTPAFRWYCVANLFYPLVLITYLAMQSTGKKIESTFFCMMREGICLIPVVMILPRFFGETGIQISQLVSDILAFLVTIPLIIRFLRKLPNE